MRWAVQYEDEQLSYAELNARANQLAHRLLDYGAGRGQCVAIVAPRGIEMLLAQLATLKAGGTYVPIDPEFPQERRLFMLQDCRATIVCRMVWLSEQAMQQKQGRMYSGWI